MTLETNAEVLMWTFLKLHFYKYSKHANQTVSIFGFKQSWLSNSFKCAILYAKHFCKHMCENYNLGSVTWIPSKMITVERQRWDPLVIVVTCWSLLVHLKTFKWKYGGSWNYILIHFNLILTIYNSLGLGRDENMKSS